VTDTPDLVLRAAARLAKPDAGRPSSNLQNNAGGREDTSLRVAGRQTEIVQEPLGKRTITLSPSVLAASGIALPSAGFSRRVEEFRSIKRQVLSHASRGNGANSDANRVVMVTSATPGDGKTFISINLALALAYERDMSVILVDADAHRQSMLNYLGISAQKGWLDVLTDSTVTVPDVLLNTNIPGLSIIPSGVTRPEIPELMSSRKMANFINDLARQHPNRLIVLDTLPCLVSTEPTILASLAGQAVFVVAANETSREEIESSLRLIEACPNVSLVLNKGNPLLLDQFSKYGYGYGYQNSS
jgi:protein-tyrosine kinase